MTLILVVEDDADNRLLLQETLESEGYAVLTASDGERAIKLLQEHPVIPDAIVLDMMMPNLDGHGFLVLKRANPKLVDIPVVLCTGVPAEKARADCYTADVMLIVQKPYTVDAVVRVLSHFRQTGKFKKFRSNPPPA